MFVEETVCCTIVMVMYLSNSISIRRPGQLGKGCGALVHVYPRSTKGDSQVSLPCSLPRSRVDRS